MAVVRTSTSRNWQRQETAQERAAAQQQRQLAMAAHERLSMREASLIHVQQLTIRSITEWPTPGTELNDDRVLSSVYRGCCFCLSWIAAAQETWCNKRVLTDIYLRARAEAMRFLITFAFSLLKKGIRDAWIILETIVSILSVFLSVATISNRLDIHPELSSVELALSVLMLTLALMDVTFDFMPRWQRYYRNAKLWLTNLIHGVRSVTLNDINTQRTLSCNVIHTGAQSAPSSSDQNINVRPNHCLGDDGTTVVEIHHRDGAERNNENEHQPETGGGGDIEVTDIDHHHSGSGTINFRSEVENQSGASSGENQENTGLNPTQGSPNIEATSESDIQSRTVQANAENDSTMYEEVTGNGHETLPNRYSKPRKIFLKFFDPVRSVLSELLIYPLLITTLFQFVTGQGYKPSNPVDSISLALFILNSLFLIAGVYLVRIIMLIAFIRTIWKLKNSNIDYENPLRRSTLLMAFWTMHIIAQMTTQVFLIIYIGVRIHVENSTPGESLNVSWQLWLLIIGGFFLPVLGTVVFFCSVYYIVQDFSLGLYLSLLGLLERRTFPDVVFESEGLDARKQEELARRLIEEIHYQEVQEEYNKIQQSSAFICREVGSSYRNPFTVAISLAYSLILCGYLTCMFFAPPQTTAASTFALISIVISNLTTFSIAIFWVSPPFWLACVSMFILVGGCCAFTSFLPSLWIADCCNIDACDDRISRTIELCCDWCTCS